jgi:hypothetical protein
MLNHATLSGTRNYTIQVAACNCHKVTNSTIELLGKPSGFKAEWQPGT